MLDDIKNGGPISEIIKRLVDLEKFKRDHNVVFHASPTLFENPENFLVNPGFDFAQLQAPATLTTIADGSYGPDQWKCYRENADLQYRRVDASGESGITSTYYGEFKKITNAGKFLVAQPLEYLNTLKFRGNEISFQLKLKSDTARTFKIAIIELQSGGVSDTIPAIVSSWNADGTDPTLGANLAVIGASLSCSVTTAWQTFNFTGTFPSTSKNLLCAIWSNADVAANGTLGVCESGLYYGTSVRSWCPINIGDQISQIERFVQKSYNVDTAPGAATMVGDVAYVAPGTQATAAPHVSYSTRMRATPTATIYSPITGTSGKRYNASSGADENMTGFNSAGENGHSGSSATHTSGSVYRYHFLLRSQL